MKTTTLLTALVTFAATLTAAAPAIDASNVSPANPLTKRGSYTACSNGVAVNCGDASISCSGEDCTVCCGSCCKQVTAPENSSCNGATPVVKVRCGKKGKGKGKKGKGRKGKGGRKAGTSQSNSESGLAALLHDILPNGL